MRVPTSEEVISEDTHDELTPEVSVVMPCLNEADTLATCIRTAAAALRKGGIRGEIVVADNGSTDGSPAIARELGARVVEVAARGYGAALMGGIAAVRGRYVVMGDADESYDFAEIPGLLARLRTGADLVMGCRLPSGGGRIMPGAMPVLHRVWGNPMFSRLARWWFRAPVHDVYCGLRAFSRELYQRLDQRCTGMEFAVEMIIKASLLGARIAEVPITLHTDGRQTHAPHLRTFQDGWRTLRFYFLYSPRWLFLVPGIVLVLFGLTGYAVAMPALTVYGVTFDAHTLLFASLAILCGHQAIVFAIIARTFATVEGLLPEDPKLMRFYRAVNLERGLLAAAVTLLVGVALLLLAVHQWWRTGFGRLDYAETMRLVIPGATLTALAVQTFFASFLSSMLGLHRLRARSVAGELDLERSLTRYVRRRR